MIKTAKPDQPALTTEDFLRHPDVTACISQLKNKFGENFENLFISDTLDDYGHQYVNLVQKGGGVLGVSLVGYTYILEQAGIRFLRMAGTSAGAINTSLIVVIGKKEEPKSEKILKHLCDLNFFDLVDGPPVIRWLIRNFITNKKFETNLKEFFDGLLIWLIALVCLDMIMISFRAMEWARILLPVCVALTIIHLIAMGAFILYLNHLFRSLRQSGHGVNPGNFFFEWMKKIMDENGVSTVTALNEKASAIPHLNVRNPATQNADTLAGDITIITSELVSENKVEFPKMANLFRERVDDLHPAHFVRASMSIPIFFESHVIDNIDTSSESIRNAWQEHFGDDQEIPAIARFIDGGMLSNFPINIFYNPRVVEPRLPSWGIDLEDEDPSRQDNKTEIAPWSFTIYLGKLFNTIRYYYDKDFLIKNNVFKKGIGKIPLFEFNWLNFFVSDQEKLKMFIRGAQAACDFLMSFDWPKYQQDRIQMKITLDKSTKTDPIKQPAAAHPA
ncbi:MAG TPA: patatin-like phospholipase family protein [Puia sp.]|nr:patatin-like phospholipase family protein [Puia sp.]